MIRLGVDAWNLPGDRRGIGRYVRSILQHWSDSASDRIDVVLVVPQWHTWTARGRYLREVGNRPYAVVSRHFHERAHLDALWFPFNGCSWTNFSLPSVATLHDASNFFVPDYAPEARALFLTAAQRCRALITDSRFAQEELARALCVPRARLVPIPLGVDPPRAPAPVALDVAALGSFVLYVGEAERRKGFDTLLAAMARESVRRLGLSLVVTTRLAGWDVPSGVSVVELGFVDDDTLAALYRGCAMLAFPSRYEGFGLPVVEAMSYGAPVVASNASSVPEAGGEAACYVPSGDDEALAEAVARIVSDPAYSEELRARGRAHAAKFTWAATAERTLEVIEGALTA